jgi:pantothenate kinase
VVSTLGNLDEIVRVIDAAAAGRRRILVGIAGSPGSGKSTIAAALVERLERQEGPPSHSGPATGLNSTSPSSRNHPALGPGATPGQGTTLNQYATLLPMDGFHLSPATLVQLGRRERMGAPDTFDVDAFVDCLHSIRSATEPVWVPGFDRSIEEPVPAAFAVPSHSSVVVVEGNYLLHDAGGWERVRPLLDVSLFVDLDRDIRLERLVRRHEQFGKSPAAALAWATGPDEWNAELIEATAGRADHRIKLGSVANSGDPGCLAAAPAESRGRIHPSGRIPGVTNRETD